MPLTGAAVLIGCCSIAGLPLFNGFVSEWLTFRSLLAGSALINTKAQIILPLMVGILALIGGLAAACFVKTFGMAFLGRPRSAGAEHAQEAPSRYAHRVCCCWPPCCLAIGIFPGLLLRPLVSLVQALIPGAGVPEETLSIARIMPWIAAIVLGTGALVAFFKRRERIARTWACGLPGLSSRMQYTSTVFSKPIRFVFARVYRPDRKVETLPADQPYFPVSISYRSVRTTSYERALYRPFVELDRFAGTPVAPIADGKHTGLSALHLSGARVAAHVPEVREMKIAVDILQAAATHPRRAAGAWDHRAPEGACCKDAGEPASGVPTPSSSSSSARKSWCLPPRRRCFVLRRSCCSEPQRVRRHLCQSCMLRRCWGRVAISSCLCTCWPWGGSFLSLGALDGGSAFGGMGASREALVSSLAEAPFLLGLVAIAISGVSRRHRGNGRVDARAEHLQHFRGTYSGLHVSGDGDPGRDRPHARGQPDHPSRVDHDPRGNGARILGAQSGADRMGKRDQAARHAGPADRAVLPLGDGVQRLRRGELPWPCSSIAQKPRSSWFY